MSFSFFIRGVPKLRGVYIGVALFMGNYHIIVGEFLLVQLAASNLKPELLNPET